MALTSHAIAASTGFNVNWIRVLRMCKQLMNNVLIHLCQFDGSCDCKGTNIHNIGNLLNKKFVHSIWSPDYFFFLNYTYMHFNDVNWISTVDKKNESDLNDVFDFMHLLFDPCRIKLSTLTIFDFSCFHSISSFIAHLNTHQYTWNWNNNKFLLYHHISQFTIDRGFMCVRSSH